MHSGSSTASCSLGNCISGDCARWKIICDSRRHVHRSLSDDAEPPVALFAPVSNINLIPRTYWEKREWMSSVCPSGSTESARRELGIKVAQNLFPSHRVLISARRRDVYMYSEISVNPYRSPWYRGQFGTAFGAPCFCHVGFFSPPDGNAPLTHRRGLS